MDPTRQSGLKPTILSVIKGDGQAALGSLLVVFGFISLPMIIFNEPKQAYLGLLVPLAGLVLLSVRVRVIRGVFSEGEEVVARVASCVVVQGLGSIPTSSTKLTYHFRGEDYEVQTYLFSKRYWRRPFDAGDEILLVVDARNPKRVFPRDLFI